MIKSIEYQTKAVDELMEKTIKLLEQDGERKKLIFKAPTGSGKTVMASTLLDRLVTELPERAVGMGNVAFIWIAPNKLHVQSYMKMKNYFTETRVLHPVTFDEMDHSNDGYIHPGEILFVNWESINKEKNVIVRDNEAGSSLYDICRRTRDDYGMPIVVIIDEEHMFNSSKAAKKSENVLRRIMPKVEIRISATPDITMIDEMVNIPRSEVVKAEMIKDGITLNPKVEDPETGMSSNDFLLEEALKKREEIKRAYEELHVRVNPLLLIQLPNDNSEVLSADERTLLELLTLRLRTEHDITTDNHKLAVWLSNEKTNLEGIEDNYNMTEVMLFKQAVAMGWDCPRAAVLLVFRDIKSFEFSIQTVGRILRMPEQHYYPNALLNHGYVYTNLSNDIIKVVKDDMNYISKALMAQRKEDFCNVSLTSFYMERLAQERSRLGADFYKVLIDTIKRKWGLNVVEQDLFSPFGDDE